MTVKAIGMLSGGLDSTLAVGLMLDQGVEVTALNFITPFCTCTRKGCRHEASRVAEEFGIDIKVMRGGEDYVRMIKDPAHGYGKNMNPCIDCRIFMLKKAKEYMREIGAKFIFTGEVLGQRPMSQRKDAMLSIDKEAGLERLILRPLSAQYLEPAIPEEEGLIDREKLLDIRGRQRKRQMELAEDLDITDYPCPAGGCRLTDPQYARRIRDAFEHDECSVWDVTLLRYGRHFRLDDGTKAVVGRDEDENRVIQRLARVEDLLLEVMGVGSPTTLLKDGTTGRKIEDIDIDEESVRVAASLCTRYSDSVGKGEVRLYVKDQTEVKRMLAEPSDEDFLRSIRVN